MCTWLDSDASDHTPAPTQEMDTSSVSNGDTLRLEAVVHNGKEPYVYEWYHNGTSVGTNSPIYKWVVPAFTPDGSHDFRVSVTDAEGDAGSYTKGVKVDGVDYGGGDGDRCLQEPCP